MFEIKDPNIDSEKIQQLITNRIEQRRQDAKERLIDFDSWCHSIDIGRQLQESAFSMVGTYKSQIYIKPYEVTDTQSVRDRVVAWLRKQTHNLVIYYANLLGRKQMLFNESLAHIITIQKKQIEDSQDKIQTLEARLQKMETLLMNNEAQADG